MKDEMILNHLKPNERAIIIAIRRWQELQISVSCPILSRAICKKISIFITFLERTDPFVIKTGSLFEQELQIFEVQLLYVLSEQQAGNRRIISELVPWWFASSDQAHAHKCIEEISLMMKSLSVNLKSEIWIKEYFYNKTFGSSKIKQLHPAYDKTNSQIPQSEPLIIH
jgi:hypothetical protein